LNVSPAELETYGLREGDVVINRVNSMEYLGKSAIIPALAEPVVFESNMMRFRVNPVIALPSYVVAFLQSGFIKGQIGVAAKQAVNQASINQRDVSGFRINVPPLALQQTFAHRIAAIEALKTIHCAALAELDALFASLQHRAFRGEL
jgi:type I restriction enzyme S subunit